MLGAKPDTKAVTPDVKNSPELEALKKTAAELMMKGNSVDAAIVLNNTGCLLINKTDIESQQKGFSCFVTAAKKGNLHAKTNLAYCYLIGVGTKKDLAAARLLLQETADHGIACSQVQIGLWSLADNNKTAAEKCFVKAANQKYSAGQYYLGELLFREPNIKKNKKKLMKAVLLIRQAANQGFLRAQYKMYELHQAGTIVHSQNTANNQIIVEDAAYWLAKIKNTYPEFTKPDKILISTLIELQKPTAFKWQELPANIGITPINIPLSSQEAFDRGSDYAGIDDAKAVGMFRMAAEQKHAPACLQMSIGYEYGLGVTKDSKISADWCEKAAKLGDVEAELALGCRLLSGRGISQDIQKAKIWFVKAAANPIDSTWHNIQRVAAAYYTGEGVVKNLDHAFMLYEILAEKGCEEATMELERLKKITMAPLAQSLASIEQFCSKGMGGSPLHHCAQQNQTPFSEHTPNPQGHQFTR